MSCHTIHSPFTHPVTNQELRAENPNILARPHVSIVYISQALSRVLSAPLPLLAQEDPKDLEIRSCAHVTTRSSGLRAGLALLPGVPGSPGLALLPGVPGSPASALFAWYASSTSDSPSGASPLTERHDRHSVGLGWTVEGVDVRCPSGTSDLIAH
eukprot:1194728-Prorocentrum_minimum.AAC.1